MTLIRRLNAQRLRKLFEYVGDTVQGAIGG